MFGYGANQEKELLQAGYRYALSLTHHPHDAEDFVQTACLKLYSKKGRMKSKALLFKTIRNLFFDQQRRCVPVGTQVGVVVLQNNKLTIADESTARVNHPAGRRGHYGLAGAAVDQHAGSAPRFPAEL